MSFDKEAFEEQVIADMREHGGVISSGPMAGTRLLVLTTTGARTGQRRRALLFFSKDGAEYLIAGTASGSTRDPAWLHNLEANPTPSVEVDGRQFEASATIAEGPERIDSGSSTSRPNHNWPRMRSRPAARSRWCD